MHRAVMAKGHTVASGFVPDPAAVDLVQGRCGRESLVDESGSHAGADLGVVFAQGVDFGIESSFAEDDPIDCG